MTGRDYSDAFTSQGMPRIAGTHQKARKKQGGSSPRAFRESIALSMSCFWISTTSKTVREGLSVVLIYSVLWYVVIASLGNIIHHFPL